MINEIVWGGRIHIEKFILNIDAPPAIINRKFAAISIRDPMNRPISFPPWMNLVLCLDFPDVIPPTDDLSKEAKEFLRQFHLNYRVMTVEQADKIVRFLDAIEKDNQSISLLVNCEAGISRSAAIVRFVKGVIARPIQTQSLSIGNFEFANRHVAKLLEENWMERVRKDVTRNARP